MKKFYRTIPTIHKIDLPREREIQNAFKCYKTSIETEIQESEQGRLIYSEIFKEIPEKNQRPDLLSVISLKKYSENFKKGIPDERIICTNSKVFGGELDIELPVADLIDIDVVYSD